MTEPVAYMYEDHVFNTEKEAVLFKKEFDRYKHDSMLKHVILPLFTADEISDIYRQNNRVKMTQVEFDEFKKLLLIGTRTIYVAFDEIVSGGGETDEFEQLYNRLFTNGVNGQVEQQNEFATLWANYNPDDPEETIEIVPVPDKKWFVRSKNATKSKIYEWLDEYKDYFIPLYTRGRKVPKTAVKFDTKEEAELWKNPLTEAVQLPLEGE